MSCSESSSDDDFESADEGDSTDDYVIIPNLGTNQIQAIESISNSKKIEPDVTSSPSSDEKPKSTVNLDHEEFSEKAKLEQEVSGNESSTQCAILDDETNPINVDSEACSKKGQHADLESENESGIEFITLDDKPSPINLVHEACSEDVNHKDEELENKSCIQPTKSEDLVVPVVLAQTDNHSIQQENNEATQLPEILNEISTRKISSRVRQGKPRPTLGAKKLGAIRIPNQSSSSETFPTASAPTVSDHKKETIESEHAAELPSEEAHYPVKVDNQSVEEVSSSSGWGWFSPPTSLISSVSALTTQILSTVETGFNIPEPEELAKEDMAACCAESDDRQDDSEGSSIGFSQLVGGVSNLTRFVENTGSIVFSSGLDTLELIGKKTYTALQQSDPGFKKTKAVLSNPIHGSNDTPSLSQVLRDAKEQNITCSPEPSETTSHETAKSLPSTLNVLLEEFQCFAHVEALELLSQQCSLRISPQMHRLTAQRKAMLGEIDQICTENPEESFDGDDLFYVEVLEMNLSSALTKISMEYSIKKLIDAFSRGTEKTYEDIDSSKEIYADALRCLAEITSLSLELMHKCAEFLLMPKAVNMKADVKMETQVLQNITFIIVKEISTVGSQYASQIIQTENRLQISSNYSTDIYYETSNCSTYLLNALRSMSPILKARTFQ